MQMWEKEEEMRVSDNTAISMPMRNLLSILGAVAVGVWAYFGVIERINSIENDNVLIKKDLDQAVEFSIKWPRGELGSLPADSEQFLLIESLLGDVEYIQLEIKESRHNAVNISLDNSNAAIVHSFHELYNCFISTGGKH